MDLRPSVLDDLGILATIGWFTREFQKVYAHISVEKQISVEENEIPDSFKNSSFQGHAGGHEQCRQTQQS